MPAGFHSWEKIVRGLWIGLVVAAGLGWPAAAETGISPADSQRWDPSGDTISVSDEGGVPYVAYFTPPYRSTDPTDIAWSMMATRWRATGEIRLSVGVRIVHDGEEPWRIVGWHIADTRFPPRTLAASPEAPVTALKPFKACRDGRCRTYEAASFALPRAALAQATPDATLEIALVTVAGDTPVIRFPAAILADLR